MKNIKSNTVFLCITMTVVYLCFVVNIYVGIGAIVGISSAFCLIIPKIKSDLKEHYNVIIANTEKTLIQKYKGNKSTAKAKNDSNNDNTNKFGSSRMRSHVKAEALEELIKNSSKVFVMGHKYSDLDSMGSCLGICAISRGLQVPCNIVINDITAGIKRLVNRIEEEDEKYLDLFFSVDKTLECIDEKSLLIIVDTHRKSLVESFEVVEKFDKVVLFDHHRKSQDIIEDCVLTYHEPYASSTSELITEMIWHMGDKVELTNLEADALLAGVTVDTKNFGVNTGAVTFEVAGFLRRHGADGVRVRLMFQNDLQAYKAKASVVYNAEIFLDKIAISDCPTTAESPTLIVAQAADDLMNVAGIIASFVCCSMQNVIYVSARSFGEINVQHIMAKLGGGGHSNVSGCQLEDCTIDEAKEKIKFAIEQYIHENKENDENKENKE